MDPVTIDIVDALSGAVTSIQEQVGGALPIALTVGGLILAAGIAWKLFKRFVRG
jgi:hypothetical protein